jgi:hypothetical protein
MTSHQSAGTSLDARVDEMLLDAGAAGDTDLRAALLALGALAALPAPAPSGDLAQLMAAAGSPGGAPGDAPGDELVRRRRRRTIHRPTLLGIAIIAGMGTGIGGVAASSPAPWQSGSLSVQALLADWSPSWSLSAPVPAPAPVAALPAEAEVTEVPEQPVQATQPGPLASSTPPPDATQPDSAGQMTERQQPPVGRPEAAPDGSARASENGGARGKGIAEAPGRSSVELPAAAGGGTGQAGPGTPTGPGGNATAGESRHTGSLVKPLAEVLRPVVAGTAVADKPVPLESWLQKFQR